MFFNLYRDSQNIYPSAVGNEYLLSTESLSLTDNENRHLDFKENVNTVVFEVYVTTDVSSLDIVVKNEGCEELMQTICTIETDFALYINNGLEAENYLLLKSVIETNYIVWR